MISREDTNTNTHFKKTHFTETRNIFNKKTITLNILRLKICIKSTFYKKKQTFNIKYIVKCLHTRNICFIFAVYFLIKITFLSLNKSLNKVFREALLYYYKLIKLGVNRKS